MRYNNIYDPFTIPLRTPAQNMGGRDPPTPRIDAPATKIPDGNMGPTQESKHTGPTLWASRGHAGSEEPLLRNSKTRQVVIKAETWKISPEDFR